MKIAIVTNGTKLAGAIMSAWRASEDTAFDEGLELILVESALDSLEMVDPNLVMVITDTLSPDYEKLALETARSLDIRVLTVHGRASTVLIGPLEVPGEPTCATCLEIRWNHSLRRTEMNQALSTKFPGTKPPNIPLSLDDSQFCTVGAVVMDEIRHIQAGQTNHVKGAVGLCRRGHAVEWITIVPSHLCPRCGRLPHDHPNLATLRFESRGVEDLDALRERLLDADRIDRLYAHPDVGYVSCVHQVWTEDDAYVQASAVIQVPNREPQVGYGSGFSATFARQKAILEVLERVCAVESTNRRPMVWGTYSKLKEDAIHPYQFGVHDEAYYQSGHNVRPFDEASPYSWIWAYSTQFERPVLIPEQIAHYGRTRDSQRFVKESSSGCALGGTLEEAVLHGIFEVIERDGFLNTWYAKLPIPELKLDPSGYPESVNQSFTLLQRAGYDVRLFNTSHDLAVPSILAVAVATDDKVPKVVCGSSCHIHPYEATEGALRELVVQVLHLRTMPAARRLEGLAMLEDPTRIREILDHVVVAGLPEAFPRWQFLLEGQRQLRSLTEAYQGARERYQIESNDIRIILGAVLADIHARGFDVLVVNQTNMEASFGGFSAVKVIIPGMTPITFGHGSRRVTGLLRVFELPSRLGYTTDVLTIDDLNQVCHPFA